MFQILIILFQIFVQQVRSANLISGLSTISIKTIIPGIVSGDVQLISIPFTINNSEDEIELLAAFLVKHILKPGDFPTELVAIHESRILSNVLSKHIIKLDSSLYEKFLNWGIFQTLADQTPLNGEIREVMCLILKGTNDPNKELISTFIASLPKLSGYRQLRELCDILFHLIKLEEFDAVTGHNIIMNYNYIPKFRAWTEFMLKISIREGSIFYETPLLFIRNVLEDRSIVSKGIVLKDSANLSDIVKMSTDILISFVTTYERALFVLAIIFYRAKFGIEIDGGDSCDIQSQITVLETANNNFITPLLKSSTGCTNVHEVKTLKELLLKYKKLKGQTINFGDTKNPSHLVIKSICLVVDYALNKKDPGKEENFDFFKSSIVIPSFIQNIIFESNQKVSMAPFLDILRFKEFETIFGVFLDEYFYSFINSRRKVAPLEAGVILQALTHIGKRRGSQLIECLDFEDDHLIRNRIFNYINKFPWDTQQLIIKRLEEAYEKKGISEKVEKLIESAAGPVKLSDEGVVLADITVYSDEANELFKEFSINAEGRLQFPPERIRERFQRFDRNLEFFQTTDDFLVMTLKSEKKDSILCVVPMSKFFRDLLRAKIVLDRIDLLRNTVDFETYLNLIEYYSDGGYFPLN
jgi:hypothetical protein